MKKKFRMKQLINIIAAWLMLCQIVNAQSCDWQMRVRYTMAVDFYADRNQYRSKQNLTIYNNSPDTLQDLFFHLYPNAFQPGSDMDIRSRTIADPDPRVGSRISALKESETGFIHPEKITVGRLELPFEIEGTIMRLRLQHRILPGDSCRVSIKYLAQVPLQIRRSGRHNQEGVDFSMAQWYPKLCEYDRQGWHTDPYIGREFYAPWGDFDVTIRIDPKYVVAATGYLQTMPPPRNSKKWKTWRFVAPNVHDFVWAADPEYVQQSYILPDNRRLLFYHIHNSAYDSAWSALPQIMHKALEFIEKRYGPYPYQSYSFIQGGDGGMEYPMATLIKGHRPLNGLVGLCLHEWMHTWYQMMLATNESLYPWMDEGFTSFAEEEVKNYIVGLGLIPGIAPVKDPLQSTIDSYIKFKQNVTEEALCTHADHYRTNQDYGVGSYQKGALCLTELKYIMGEESFREGMLNYYWKWRFRHPGPDDFFSVMEKASGMNLDWFQQYWVHRTASIDYAISSIETVKSNSVQLVLKRIGDFPMPVDFLIRSRKGERRYTIPLELMRGSKSEAEWIALKPWHWVNPDYTVLLDIPLSEIISIEIDPERQMPDLNRDNNLWRGVH